MLITFDPAKRQATFEARGLDFTDAARVFAGTTADVVDDRRDYGETRFVTMGSLNKRIVVIVWTPRGQARHIISMRKANEREQKSFRKRLR